MTEDLERNRELEEAEARILKFKTAERLGEEPFLFVVRHYAKTGSPSASIKAMYSEYPLEEGTPKVPDKEIENLFKSKSIGNYCFLLSKDSERAVRKSVLAQDFGRIRVLVDVLSRLLTMFQGAKLQVKDRLSIAGEIRQYVRELRAETEPFDFEALKGMSAYDQLRRQYARIQSEDPSLAKQLDEPLPKPKEEEPN